MSDPSDEKIELLVRSVLAAVDARLVGVRSEIEAVATDVARRHSDTQALLERIDAMHQRNTIATNERFALINQALEHLNSVALVPAATPVPMASLDGMNAPLRVGASSGPVPAALLVPAAASMPEDVQEPAVVLPPPSSPPITAPVHETSDELSEPIDMGRLADLLSERLGSLNLPAPMTAELSRPG